MPPPSHFSHLTGEVGVITNLDEVPERRRVSAARPSTTYRELLETHRQNLASAQTNLTRVLADVQRRAMSVMNALQLAANEAREEERILAEEAARGSGETLRAYLEKVAEAWPDREFRFATLGTGATAGWSLSWVSPPQPVRDADTGHQTVPLRYPVTLRVGAHGEASVRAERPVEPVRFPSTLAIHPHISSGDMCIVSETRELISKAIHDGEPVTPILMVEALLAHYQNRPGEGGPYMPLRAWVAAWPSLVPADGPRDWLPWVRPLSWVDGRFSLLRRGHPDNYEWGFQCVECGGNIRPGEGIFFEMDAGYRGLPESQWPRYGRLCHGICRRFARTPEAIAICTPFLSPAFWRIFRGWPRSRLSAGAGLPADTVPVFVGERPDGTPECELWHSTRLEEAWRREDVDRAAEAAEAAVEPTTSPATEPPTTEAPTSETTQTAPLDGHTRWVPLDPFAFHTPTTTPMPPLAELLRESLEDTLDEEDEGAEPGEYPEDEDAPGDDPEDDDEDPRCQCEDCRRARERDAAEAEETT